VHVPADTVVRVHGTNGGVTLTGLRAEVEARTSNGSIRASGLSSAVVRLASRRGDVSADFAADPTEVRVTTEHGDLRVTVPKGRPYAVAASAAIGGVKVDVAQQADAPRGIAARTETGDVTVTGA
jgi:DUF4097 and DUF4098 domain-containing protein YvlB